EYHYDSADRLTEQVDPLKGKTSYSYDNLGNILAVTDAEGNKTQYAYDGLGQVTTVTDGAGQVTRLYYDANGNLTKVVNPKGGTTEYKYDVLNRLEAKTDPGGAKTQYTYNQVGQVTKVRDALNHQTTLDYDVLGRLVTSTDALGNITKYEYNSLNQVSKFTKPNGGVSELKYNDLGQLTTMIDPLGNQQTWTYDSNGNVSGVRNPLGSTTQYSYDSLNRVKTITNANNFVKEFQYTKRGELAKVIDEKGQATTYTYDALGRMSKVTDALGFGTDYQYDKVGNLTAVFRYRQTPQEAIDVYNKSFSLTPLSTTSLAASPLAASPLTITPLTVASGSYGTSDTSGNSGNAPELAPAVYDGNYSYNAPTRVADAAYSWFSTTKIMQPTYYRYDQRYLLKEVENAQGKITAYDYDANGNLTKITDRDGLATSYNYDQADRVTKISYADGKQVNFGYNLLGQMTAMSDWLGSNTFEVDPLGRVTKVTDFLNRVTKYSYTSTGQKSALVYPDGSSVTYGYNLLDQLTGVTDAFGKTTNYNYDPAENMIERVLPNGSRTTLSYDPLSQVQKLLQLDPSGKITDNYEFSYDAAGNKTQITKRHMDEDNDDPEGKDNQEGNDLEENDTLKFTYDALNQLKSVTEDNDERRDYLYDSVGNRVALIETDSVQPAGQLGKDTDGQTSGDLDNDLDDEPEELESVFYRYDNLNRLSQIKEADGDIKDLSYDGRGNLTKLQSHEQGESDDNGHLFSQFTFDAANRLVGTVNKHGDKTDFTYNGFGQRVQAVIDLDRNSGNGNENGNGNNGNGNGIDNGTDNPGNHNGWENGLPPGLAKKPGWTQQFKRTNMVTNYAVDLLSPTQDVLLSYGEQVQTQRFTYGLGMLSTHFQSLADHDNGWAPQGDTTVYSGTWETLYALQDELGSVVKLIGEDGKKSAHYNYDEFGRPEGAVKFDPNWPGPDNVVGYTGYSYDYFAGLYYANARYYMPEVGRFISEDPWNGTLAQPNTLNPYPYVLNNPLKYVDPLGLSPQTGRWGGDTQGTGNPVVNSPSQNQSWGDKIKPGASWLVDKAAQGLESAIQNNSPLGNWIEGGTGKTLITRQELTQEQRQERIDKGFECLESGLISLGTGGVKGVKGPNFVVTPRGEAIPIPNGASGPVPVINPAGKTTGFGFTGGKGGANGKIDSVRIMDPTQPRGNSPGYPEGYVKYENATQQGVDPVTGKTLPNSQSHFPLK
ncbi:MAG: RHS repeat-associated core domain-containing protein, partial [Carboxydocellales bacterium]